MRAGVCALVAAALGCGRGRFDDLPDGMNIGDDAPVGCRITQLRAAEYHACALYQDGSAKCWGYNFYGNLGDGTLTDSATPVAVLASAGGAPFPNISRISTGVGFSNCAWRSDKTAWCWGDNRHGQLGDGTITDSSFPKQVMASPGVPLIVDDIVMGEDHTCAVTPDSHLWCWGWNNYGQIGNPSAGMETLLPLEVLTPTSSPIANVAGVNASVSHTCAWKTNGDLACWGRGEGGRLGVGGGDQPAPVDVPLPNVQLATSAYRHTCALVAGGTLSCFGYDTSGELGDAMPMANQYAPVSVLGPGGVGTFTFATDVSAGDSFTCARRSDSTVWCWGINDEGNLGNGNIGVSSSVPVQVPLSFPAASVAVGNKGACALSTDGLEVWCWGRNVEGQLGTGSFSPSSAVPVKALASCQ